MKEHIKILKLEIKLLETKKSIDAKDPSHS